VPKVSPRVAHRRLGRNRSAFALGRPMTTLLVTEVFPPRHGGSGRWFWEVYRRLPRRDVVIAAGEYPDQEAFDRTHDLRLSRLPLTLRSWGLCGWQELRDFWRPLRALRRLVRAHQIDSVHCGKCLPEGALALALKVWLGVPYVCYAHGEEMTLAATSRELTWMSRRVLRGARFLIANSRNTARLLREQWGVPARRIRVLHPGVDTTRFTPAGRDRELRARLGWSDRPVVLTVGRLQKRKGHDVMIRALPEVRRSCPDVLYAVVGDGEERATLQGLVADLRLGDYVRFHGELTDDEMLRCYQQCDLFVLANRQVGQDIEGFGMVLLEAQACGKPVVAGASGGTAETMRIPETGLIVPCDEPGPLATVVSELLSDPERSARLGVAGRRWVVERFDWVTLSLQAIRLFPGMQSAQLEKPALNV
jgi:phosphatidylinositol alpha-1,6-mannosyltransferase